MVTTHDFLDTTEFVSDRPPGAGEVEGGMCDIVSRPAEAGTVQLETITITAVDSTDYTLKLAITGKFSGLSYTYTSDADATMPEIAEGLADLVNADPRAATHLTAFADGNLLKLEGVSATQAFVVDDADDANLTTETTVAASESAPILFGTVVAEVLSGTKDLSTRNIKSGDSQAAGVAVKDNSIEWQDANGTAGWKAPRTVPVMRKGRIWVRLFEGVNPTLSSTPYVNPANGMFQTSNANSAVTLNSLGHKGRFTSGAIIDASGNRIARLELY